MAENNLFDQNIPPVQQGVSNLLTQDYNTSTPQGNTQQGSSQLSGGQYSSGFGQDAFSLRQSMQPQTTPPQPQPSVYTQPAYSQPAQPVYPQQQPYTQPGYQDPGYSQVPPMPEYNFAMESDVSVGEWLLSTILALMPFVGFILLLVWAFSSETAKAKQNWARAMLIIKVVGIILAALGVVSMGVLFARILNNLSGNFW